MKVALYARVSTVDKEQNPEVQLAILREYCQRMDWKVSKEYVDKAPAVDLPHRTAWTQLMKDASLRKYETLLVFKIDRAFRSNIHAHNTLSILQKYRVDFRSYSEPAMDTNTPNGAFLFSILAAFTELERGQIRERVIAGMAYAKVKGTKSGLPIGRPRRAVAFNNVCKALVSGKGYYSAAARILSEELEAKIVAGFIWMRVKREADNRGIPMEELKRQIMAGELADEPLQTPIGKTEGS